MKIKEQRIGLIRKQGNVLKYLSFSTCDLLSKGNSWKSSTQEYHLELLSILFLSNSQYLYSLGKNIQANRR